MPHDCSAYPEFNPGRPAEPAVLSGLLGSLQ